MQRTPLLVPPTTCFNCELFHPNCDICSSKASHCMRYHAQMPPSLACCSWRSTATTQEVRSAIELANDQLRVYYSSLHENKQRNIRLSKGKNPRRHVRGLTRRLTITPDMFRQS